MGAITRAAANNVTTGGLILPAGINDASVASITELAQVSAGDGSTLISSQTASASASISFTGLDNTYRTYYFTYSNIHTQSDSDFSVNFSIDNGSNYNVTKTTTFFRAYHREDDSQTGLGYLTGYDLAQGTSEQSLGLNTDSGASDSCISGRFWLFNPSSTTYVKHFLSQSSGESGTYAINSFVAGYGNTTSAINAITFKAKGGGGAGGAGGNIDDGTITMYGIA